MSHRLCLNSRRLVLTVPVCGALLFALTVSMKTLAGPPKNLVLRGSAPSMETPKALEIASRDPQSSLPGQLYKALSLVESDVLVKSSERISLKDPHSDFQLTCRSDAGFTCTFSTPTPNPELGWTVSESSAQAVLFRALQALSKEPRKDHKMLGVRADDDEVILRLGDAETSSSLSCTKRTEESVQFSCRIRIRT